MLVMNKSNHGFTLIELLVTIAVVVIMATIAVPNFQSFISSSRQAAEFNKVLTGFHYARSEAVKKRENIMVDIDDSSGRWVMSVSNSDGAVIRRVDSKDGLIDVDNFTVGFNALGRLLECKNSSGSAVSPCVISVGSAGIQVNAAGNISKAD